MAVVDEGALVVWEQGVASHSTLICANLQPLGTGPLHFQEISPVSSIPCGQRISDGLVELIITEIKEQRCNVLWSVASHLSTNAFSHLGARLLLLAVKIDARFDDGDDGHNSSFFFTLFSHWSMRRSPWQPPMQESCLTGAPMLDLVMASEASVSV